jgi:hypothetical protein
MKSKKRKKAREWWVVTGPHLTVAYRTRKEARRVQGISGEAPIKVREVLRRKKR